MDAYDIYQKLIFGTTFDASKMKKKRRRRNGKQEGSENQKVQTNGSSSTEPKNDVESDTEMVKNSEDESEGDVSDIELMRSNVESRKVKKKKEKDMSLMKLAKIRQEEIRHLRKVHRIYVEGSDIPDVIETFQQLGQDYGVHSAVLSNIEKLGYVTPTPVQMQVIPLLINERQVLACAPTGSGKTAAFLIPIIHCLKGPSNVGFRALILVPTRELAKQIYQDCLRLAEGTNLRPHVVEKVKNIIKKPKFANKYDILISTPNRLIFMLQQDPPLVTLNKVQWFIIDESDKLFEAGKQGFREQLATVYKACDSVQVKRAMFSATFSHDVEQWCKLNLDSVVAVSIGVKNTAVTTVKQELVFVGCDSGKLLAFRELIRKGVMPPVLVFVQSKERARDLFKELIYDGIMVDVIHADRPQLQRDNVVRAFRAGKIWVLICTELMGRGIDFKGVNLVVNYDFPPSAISYIHRIGRTGRAGNPGHAITYFTEDDVENLRSIAQVIKNAGCEVPDYIMHLKKKSKNKKKQVTVPVKRQKICTTPKYILQRESKKKMLIKNSKARKQRKEKQKVESGDQN